MTAARSLASVFLRRAGMFSLVFALIAGIFGMHVMNGHHNVHGPASAMRGSVVAGAESAGQSGHPHHSPEAGDAAVSARAAGTAAGQDIPAAAGCMNGDCSGPQAMTVSCIPSGKTGSLAAPVPGTAVFAAAPVRAGPAGPVSGRSAHKPDTPTPCELSISRT